MTELMQAIDESAALEMLHETGCTDGLPVIIPTPERVEALDGFKTALSAARARGGINLIEVTQDPLLIAPGKWLT